MRKAIGTIKSGEEFRYKGQTYRRVTPEEWKNMEKGWKIRVAPVPGEPGMFMLSHQNCICVIGGQHGDVFFLNCEEHTDRDEVKLGDWVLANGRNVCRIKERVSKPDLWGDKGDRYYFDVGIDWAWVDDCMPVDLEDKRVFIKDREPLMTLDQFISRACESFYAPKPIEGNMDWYAREYKRWLESGRGYGSQSI